MGVTNVILALRVTPALVIGEFRLSGRIDSGSGG
jgi:hypothetical protein